MAGRKAQAPPAPLERLRRRFERWRQTREPHARIPGPLWAAATRLAGRYGLSKITSTLGVNYQALKRRLAARTVGGGRAAKTCTLQGAADPGSGPDRQGAAGFVELPAFVSADPGECLLEWEDGDGEKMRIRLHRLEMPDLLALARSFWDRRP